MEDASAPVRRRILLSSFACSPRWGSEPGVGWQWLLQLSRSHEVELLTHACFREHLEPALRAEGLSTLPVHYVQAPAFGVHPHRQLNSRLYYTWWQWWARGLVRRLLEQRKFDLVHHLTWGTLRFPSFLGGLGVPLVMGPLGGGEAAPMRFFQGLPWKLRAFDALRSLSLRWVRLDPLATWGPRRSELVLCKSADSLRALPRAAQAKAMVMPEIGSPPVDLTQRAGVPLKSPRRLLFAGRLLGWKGVDLAVGALALLKQRGLDVCLDVAGEGPLRLHLQARAAALGLQSQLQLLGAVPREELMSLYARAEIFVFPSLHDSSGNVVLEALSRGLPVVCLDLGGPQHYVSERCGRVVTTAGRSRAELELALADTLAELLADDQRLADMSRHAAEHAASQSWVHTVERAYAEIGRRLRWVP